MSIVSLSPSKTWRHHLTAGEIDWTGMARFRNDSGSVHLRK